MATRKKVRTFKGHGANQKQTANSVTRAIIDFVGFSGVGVAFRINNTGIFDAKIGKRRKSNMRKGIPDILVCWRGRFLGVEVKVGRDKLSVEQKIVAEDIVKKGGGKWIVVSNLGEFEAFVDEWDLEILNENKQANE